MRELLSDYRSWAQLSSPQTPFRESKRQVWAEANATLEGLGLAAKDGGILGDIELPIDEQEMAEADADAIATLEAAAAALASTEAFQSALSGGVFEDNEAYGPGPTATEVFEAREREVTVTLRASRGSRFGVWVANTRESALDDGDEIRIQRGQFAYTGSVGDANWPLIPLSGGASFVGETFAIDDNEKEVSGTVSLEASFADDMVTAVISELTVMETGVSWSDGVGEVEEIRLPDARMGLGADGPVDRARFEGGAPAGHASIPGLSNSRVTYSTYSTSLLPGGQDWVIRQGRIEGNFTGPSEAVGLASGPHGAIGRWEIRPDPSGRTLGLSGSFSAERQSFTPANDGTPASAGYLERHFEAGGSVSGADALAQGVPGLLPGPALAAGGRIGDGLADPGHAPMAQSDSSSGVQAVLEALSRLGALDAPSTGGVLASTAAGSWASGFATLGFDLSGGDGRGEDAVFSFGITDWTRFGFWSIGASSRAQENPASAEFGAVAQSSLNPAPWSGTGLPPSGTARFEGRGVAQAGVLDTAMDGSRCPMFPSLSDRRPTSVS